jgi:hypothetical protein
VTTPPKFLPRLTEVVVVEEPLQDAEPSPLSSAPPAPPLPAQVDELARVLSEQEVARLEQQLVQSHWLEQRLSPALRDWVEHEVANEVAFQVELLAPQWAKALAEAVSAQVMARIPGIVDRLLEETAPTTPEQRS